MTARNQGFCSTASSRARPREPAGCHGGDDPVVQVAPLVVGNDIADAEIVGEAVGFHLLGEDPGRRTEGVDGLELLGQVPFALIGGVVARLAQHVPHGSELCRHAVDPGEVGVVEHARVLDVLAGIAHRARGRAHAGIDAMVQERSPARLQTLVARQPVAFGQLTGAEEAFLVRQEEQDVVSIRGTGGAGPRWNRLGRDARGRIARAERQRDCTGTGSAEEVPTRKLVMGMRLISHCSLLARSEYSSSGVTGCTCHFVPRSGHCYWRVSIETLVGSSAPERDTGSFSYRLRLRFRRLPRIAGWFSRAMQTIGA